MSYDYLFKFVLIGDSAVGKSCLLKKLTEDRFHNIYETTIGVEFGAKIIKIRNKNIKLHIWDTAGQEHFNCITRSYYKGSAGIILMYDISRRETFEHLPNWLREIRTNASNEVQIFLVANKSDLINTRQINREEGEKFAKENRLLFTEISVKKKFNNQDELDIERNVFNILANDILTKIETNKIVADIDNGIKVGSDYLNLDKKNIRFRGFNKPDYEKYYEKYRSCCYT